MILLFTLICDANTFLPIVSQISTFEPKGTPLICILLDAGLG